MALRSGKLVVALFVNLLVGLPVTAALGLFMVGYVARTADRLPSGRIADRLPDARTANRLPGGPVAQSNLPARPYLAPRCAALCKIAMGLTMTYMLVLTL